MCAPAPVVAGRGKAYVKRWRRAMRQVAPDADDVEQMSEEVLIRRKLVVGWIVVTLFCFVGEQFIWVTKNGAPIGARWLIYLGTWAVLYTLGYEVYAYRAAFAVRRDMIRGAGLSDDTKDLTRVAFLARALINPLGLVGLASWLAFVKSSDEGKLKHRWLWEVISFLKHVGPEATFLFDVVLRPRPMLRVKDCGIALGVPVGYGSFMLVYRALGGRNYEGGKNLYAELDDWRMVVAAGALWVGSVPVCVAVHRGFMELVVKYHRTGSPFLTGAQIRDIERNVVEGFVASSTREILNGWDATEPETAPAAPAEGAPTFLRDTAHAAHRAKVAPVPPAPGDADPPPPP